MKHQKERIKMKLKQMIAAFMSMVMLLSAGIPVMADEIPSADNVYVTERKLPSGLKGMKPGFSPDKEEIELKRKSVEHNVSGTVASLTPGVDYKKDCFMYSADSLEYAKEVAAAYNAELKSFAYGIAVARLTDPNVTVAQVVAAGEDLSNNLPSVGPIYITRLEDPVISDDDPSGSEMMTDADSAADVWSWSDVTREYDDPALDPDYRFPEYQIEFDDNGKPNVITPSESEKKERLSMDARHDRHL
jgi:hypothetical protein